ncbi:hypothetical protein MSAN_00543700 [Mycena sanguinolenta]|uniref:Uncharacterized protein n=1 Tax=Mycena sanguinolenta TaxID=230812 RepID=A0A8H6ZBN9_9AGAR|nr:hypothetical protein MSAN_00543700 [Mycena sanguinolenta]
MTQPWGLCYSFENRTVTLPLLQVKAVTRLKELAAQVKIIQTYFNDTNEALEAVYSFPIPARAAVCSFVMIKQDKTRIVGRVEEKGEAKVIYESAVAQGKQAALMQQQTSDVFKLAVGNIQPQEQVQIELTYATELTEDEENDSVRFHLPVHIGARYGQGPDAQIAGGQQTSHAFLEISVDVEAAAPIAKITCPSHTVLTEVGPDPALPNAQELPFSNYARISLTSEVPLDKDFVLAVKSAGLDAPRCVAELHPIHPTTAVALTVVPRFKLPDVSRQEFVFLVDRSGSMNGARIAAAKKALIVMLRSLPAKDSLFQIASFGNACTSFWEEGSRPYNQATLDDATQHVDTMDANYGGTEISKALQKCFEARKTDRPTSLFLLTDGQAWDLNGVFKEVKDAVAKAPAHAYLRVFVLGIGNSASTAMCEGIARLGNGTCMMVGEQESFTGKIARMLKAARTPLVTDIAVDWGVPSAEVVATDEDDGFVMVSPEETGDKGKGKGKELSLFDETSDPLETDNQSAPPPPKVVLSPPPPVQQSPFKIRTLNPGNRVHTYAILQGKTVPKAVTLSGFTEDGSEIKLSVPVTLSILPNAPDSPPAIHALAARKIIQDIEDGQHAIRTSVPDDADLLARTVKASIVRLAKTYSISSSQTSFVAVDESGSRHDPHPISGLPGSETAERRRHQIEHKKAKLHELRAARVTRSANQDATARSGGDLPLPFLSRISDTEPKADGESLQLFFSSLLSGRPIQNPQQNAVDPPEMDPLEKLARLQSFDGCFAAGVLSTIQLTVPAEEVRAALGVSEDVFATLVAMAFLCTKLGSDVERESWEAMYEKARAYVEDALQGGVGVDELQARAVTYLA